MKSSSQEFQEWFLNNIGEQTSKAEFAKMAWETACMSNSKKYREAIRDMKWLLKGTEYFRNDMREYCKEIRKRHGIEQD